jgi:hypothetical protein
MPPRQQRPAFHLALGRAYHLLGDEAASSSHFRKAATLKTDHEKEN